MAIFYFLFIAELYNFCYGNKNNNYNTNKIWSLKLWNVVEL